MGIKLVNMTPHDIVLSAADGTRTTVPPSGTVARVSSTPGKPEVWDDVPVPVYSAATYGPVEGLPEKKYVEVGDGQDPVWDGTVYVVSGMVLSRCGGRDDVVGPGTGPKDGAIRDEKDRIVAVTRLVRG